MHRPADAARLKGALIVVPALARLTAKLGLLTAVMFAVGACIAQTPEARVQAAIDKPGRLAADVARDARSRPQAVLPLLDLEPGDRVLDLFAGGGYYSELLASVVGAEGEVLLHNNRGFRAWGINVLNDRFDGRTISNLTEHNREIADLDLGRNSLDAALIVMAFHDLYVVPKRYDGEAYVAVGQPADVAHVMAQVRTALEPGGRLVIVDHAGDERMALDVVLDLHRIHESLVRAELARFGFELVGASDALRNPDDDLARIVFDADLQGKTDRFVLAFRKPDDA